MNFKKEAYKDGIKGKETRYGWDVAHASYTIFTL